MTRSLARGLWGHKYRVEGILLHVIRDFITQSVQWKSKFLGQIGVPSNWPDSWDFQTAITACSTDA